MSTAYYPLGMKSYNNTLPHGGYKTWKGQVNYTYPTSSAPLNIRPMTNKDYSNNITNKFGLPKPLKHYRKGRTIVNYNIPESERTWQQLNSAVKSSSAGHLVSDTMDKPGTNYIVKPSSDGNCESCHTNASRHIINTLVNKTISSSEVPQVKTTSSTFCCNMEKNALKRVRPSNTVLNKNYYTTLQAYRQARCKTYDQKAFNFIATDESLPNNTYLANCYPNTAACKLSVYKPNNSKYAQQGAVSSSLNTMNKNVETITTNANSFNAPLSKQIAELGGNPFILKMKTEKCNPIIQNPNQSKTVCPSICDSNCN
jgi:hypothetical protein